MPDPILETEGLSKSFGAITANDDITLSFNRGECHGIIGPNGSGKTTFFNLVTGIHEPDVGTVRFDSADVTGANLDWLARQGLVRTFQVASPFGDLSVRENLLATHTSGLRSGLGVPERQRERAEAVLERLDLAHVAENAASDISGGQQQLLELGRVLMLDPKCILLDEPTAGVNPAIQRQVLAVIRELTASGTTVVVIEHDMGVVEDVTDQITVFDDGRVLTQGSFDEITDDDRVQDAYFGPETNRKHEIHTASGGDARFPPNDGDSSYGTAKTGDKDTDIGTTFTEDTVNNRLVAQNVVAGYGNQMVLDGVSISSRNGVTCLFGPNGSGKSTLLKALGGVVPIKSGTVEYGNRSIIDLAPHEVVKRGITTVPQSDRVLRGLSVRENLLLGTTTVSDDAVAERRMAEVLELFPPLAASLSEPAGLLSGGQQVMLGVARGMITGADVYLLDEPLSGLDPDKVDKVLDVVETLVDAGTQVIMVEQQVRAALGIADHVYVLSQGEIQFDGPPADLRDEDELLEHYLGIA